MQLNDWPIVCGIVSTLMSFWRQRWIDAAWSACFTAYLTFTITFPNEMPRYKKSVAVQ